MIGGICCSLQVSHMKLYSSRAFWLVAYPMQGRDFCNRAWGWGKCIVEKNVQGSRQRIWIDAQSLKFGSFDELNVWLGERYKSP